LASASAQLDRLVEDGRRTWAERGRGLVAREPAQGYAEDAYARQDAIAARELEPAERCDCKNERRREKRAQRHQNPAPQVAGT
jgi:hypothetical protein